MFESVGSSSKPSRFQAGDVKKDDLLPHLKVAVERKMRRVCIFVFWTCVFWTSWGASRLMISDFREESPVFSRWDDTPYCIPGTPHPFSATFNSRISFLNAEEYKVWNLLIFGVSRGLDESPACWNKMSCLLFYSCKVANKIESLPVTSNRFRPCRGQGRHSFVPRFQMPLDEGNLMCGPFKSAGCRSVCSRMRFFGARKWEDLCNNWPLVIGGGGGGSLRRVFLCRKKLLWMYEYSFLWLHTSLGRNWRALTGIVWPDFFWWWLQKMDILC